MLASLFRASGLLHDQILLHLNLLLGYIDVIQPLYELLIMHLLLWTGILQIILMSLNNHTGLNLQVSFVLFETLFLEVWNPKACFPPLLVEESSDEALDLDSSEMLSRHRS